MGRVDALMDLTSELQTAIEDLKGDAGLTKGEGEKFYEALVNINQAYQTLRDAKTLRDPYLADVAFYTVIRDTIAAGDGNRPYEGLAVIIGLSDAGMKASHVVLPTVLNRSDYPAVLSDSANNAVATFHSLCP